MKALKSDLARRIGKAAVSDPILRAALTQGKSFTFEGKQYTMRVVPKAH